MAHAARVGAELGADIVKTSYTGDQDSFARVVESCAIPLVIAGRNVFQHESPALINPPASALWFTRA